MADKINFKTESAGKIDGKVWFQFHKSLNLPIFVAFDENLFTVSLGQYLTGSKWSRVAEKDLKIMPAVLKEKGAKVLFIEECSPAVAKMVRSPIAFEGQLNGKGQESIILKDGLKIYRFHNEATFIYSSFNHEAKLGCFLDFGLKIEVANHVLNRFLALALSNFGIVGFWGVPVEDGVVVMRAKDSRSEAVFIDIFQKNIISVEGVARLSGKNKIFRLDPSLKGKNVKMKKEELISFLQHHCAYFDVQGLSVPVRQVILEMSKSFEGIWHPMDSFRPRLNSGQIA